MEEYHRELFHEFEKAHINKNNTTSIRDTNIYKRIWRMHILSGKVIPKEIIDSTYNKSTFFKYLIDSERLVYKTYKNTIEDNYTEKPTFAIKKKRGRPNKMIYSDYENQNENIDYGQNNNRLYDSKDYQRFYDYSRQVIENLHPEARKDFLRVQNSWSNLYKSISNGINNEPANDTYFEESQDTYGHESPHFQITGSEPYCVHCMTKETSLWRKLDGKSVCNACGLYFKLHGVVRPITLKKTTIKKRRRFSKHKKKQD